MYSSHRIESVTCLRLSSRWITAQSGSTWRREPCFVPAFLYSLASRAVSVTSSGSGQAKPTAAKRFSVSRTVDDASPVRRAISCLERPAEQRRKISRTWRIETLPAGIKSAPRPQPKSRPYAQPAEAPATPTHPGDIIPESWARINRNAGRQLIGIGGRHHLGIDGRLASESAFMRDNWLSNRIFSSYEA